MSETEKLHVSPRQNPDEENHTGYCDNLLGNTFPLSGVPFHLSMTSFTLSNGTGVWTAGRVDELLLTSFFTEKEVLASVVQLGYSAFCICGTGCVW